MAGLYDAQIAAIEEALASGELTIRADGEEVTYRSVSDMLKALRYFQQKNAQSTGQTSRTTLVAFDPE